MADEWYCEQCEELLNEQDDFDDDSDEWTCTECYHTNSISEKVIAGNSDDAGSWATDAAAVAGVALLGTLLVTSHLEKRRKKQQKKKRFGKKQPENPETATAYSDIANTYYDQGKYKEALELYLKALSIREKTLGAEHIDTAETYMDIAFVCAQLREFDIALTFFTKAYRVLLSKLGAEHLRTQQCCECLQALS